MTPPQSFARHTPGPVRLVGADIWTEHGPNTHVIAEVLRPGLVNVTYEERSATAQFLASAWDMEVFLKLLDNGGCIVSSNDCSTEEISAARACYSFFVDQDGYGYVYRPKDITKSPTHEEKPLATEIIEAAQQILEAVNGMYIEFVDTEKRVLAAEDRLDRALKAASDAHTEAYPPQQEGRKS